MSDSQKPRNGPMPLVYYASIAFEFIGFLFLPALGGYLLDTMVFNEGPDAKPSWSFVIGLFVGFGFGVYHLYTMARKMAREGFAPTESKDVREAKYKNVNATSDRIHSDLDELSKKIDSIVDKRKQKKK